MKFGIITIIGNDNYGNRLQNYALQQVLIKLGYDVTSLINYPVFNFYKKYYLRRIKYHNVSKLDSYSLNLERAKSFESFNELICFSNKIYTIKSKFDFDYLVVGSDQVWNPFFDRLSDMDLLNIPNIKKIAYSASFGISELPKSVDSKYISKCIQDFDKISVREDAGKEILKQCGVKKEIEVLLDPTMLLTREEWSSIAKKPSFMHSDNYILLYFLGDISETRMQEIKKISLIKKYKIINILDKKSQYYTCGPSEFLYLVKNASLICTDSFHASVFSILFNNTFIFYDREEKNLVNMNSRVVTLLSKLKINDRIYNGESITDGNLKHDYSLAYSILNSERSKAMNFLKVD